MVPQNSSVEELDTLLCSEGRAEWDGSTWLYLNNSTAPFFTIGLSEKSGCHCDLRGISDTLYVNFRISSLVTAADNRFSSNPPAAGRLAHLSCVHRAVCHRGCEWRVRFSLARSLCNCTIVFRTPLRVGDFSYPFQPPEQQLSTHNWNFFFFVSASIH